MHARAVDGEVVGAALVGIAGRADHGLAGEGAAGVAAAGGPQAVAIVAPGDEHVLAVGVELRSHAPWPVGRPAITGGENVRPPSWLAASTVCTSPTPKAACSHATYTWLPEVAITRRADRRGARPLQLQLGRELGPGRADALEHDPAPRTR